jgi:carbonic anhydrase
MGNQCFGFIDNWLRHIKDVYRLHQEELDAITDENKRNRRFVELNVIEQVSNLSKTSVIQEAWKNNQLPILHGWVYDMADGIIRTLDVKYKDSGDINDDIYRYDLSGSTVPE